SSPSGADEWWSQFPHPHDFAHHRGKAVRDHAGTRYRTLGENGRTCGDHLWVPTPWRRTWLPSRPARCGHIAQTIENVATSGAPRVVRDLDASPTPHKTDPPVKPTSAEVTPAVSSF